MRKSILVYVSLFLLLLLAVVLTVCGKQNYQEGHGDMDLLAKAWYGDHMGFEFRIISGDDVLTSGSVARILTNPRDQRHNPFYTDVVFVHNEAEAQDFPDNIIVAWPQDNEWTAGLIAGMHWAVNRTEDDLIALTRDGIPRGFSIRSAFTLEDFGLSYPITITDLVDNWEKVADLWNAFAPGEREEIHRMAPRGGPAARE